MVVRMRGFVHIWSRARRAERDGEGVGIPGHQPAGAHARGASLEAERRADSAQQGKRSGGLPRRPRRVTALPLLPRRIVAVDAEVSGNFDKEHR